MKNILISTKQVFGIRHETGRWVILDVYFEHLLDNHLSKDLKIKYHIEFSRIKRIKGFSIINDMIEIHNDYERSF